MISGVGVDMIEVDRIAKAVEKWGNHFLNHVFTEDEIAYCFKFKYPFEHFAGRFAAKEAVIKALGETKDFEWKKIRILNDPAGKPHCVFDEKNFKSKIHVSISHTKHYAIAFATIAS